MDDVSLNPTIDETATSVTPAAAAGGGGSCSNRILPEQLAYEKPGFGTPRRGVVQHPLGLDGLPPKACITRRLGGKEVEGWAVIRQLHCTHEDSAIRAAPEVCGKLDCVSSYEQNRSKRSRRLWDGTARLS